MIGYRNKCCRNEDSNGFRWLYFFGFVDYGIALRWKVLVMVELMQAVEL